MDCKISVDADSAGCTPSPLPLLPTNRKSLNIATWFSMNAMLFLSSAHRLSLLPADSVTFVPSLTSPNATTMKAAGRDLFDLQCSGSNVQTTFGHPVRTRFPEWSLRMD